MVVKTIGSVVVVDVSVMLLLLLKGINFVCFPDGL